MSEVKRYQADWHGMFLDLPGRRMGTEERLVVLASDFDRVTAERDAALAELAEVKESMAYRGSLLCRIEGQRDALQALLTAADERWDELVRAVRSINRSPQYKVMAIDDDEPQYRQRKEWIDWVLGLCDMPLKRAEGGGDDS